MKSYHNGSSLRFGQKLPSSKTLIAKPLEMTHPEMEEEDRNKLKARATEVLSAAKKLLDDPEFDENMSIMDFCNSIKTPAHIFGANFYVLYLCSNLN